MNLCCNFFYFETYFDELKQQENPPTDIEIDKMDSWILKYATFTFWWAAILNSMIYYYSVPEKKTPKNPTHRFLIGANKCHWLPLILMISQPPLFTYGQIFIDGGHLGKWPSQWESASCHWSSKMSGMASTMTIQYYVPRKYQQEIASDFCHSHTGRYCLMAAILEYGHYGRKYIMPWF